MSSRKGAAIISGAAQGIGRAIALRLAQDGYDIAVNDIPLSSAALETLTEEIISKGRKAIFVTGDISQEQVVQLLVDKTVEELGELRVMVANAGIASPSGQIINMSLETWDRYLAVNLTGVFLCYRAAARQMIKQGHGGRIIGASSTFGKRAQASAGVYSTTKFGVRGLTQALATELAKEGITVNAYAPGPIDTAILASALSTIEGQPIITDKDNLDARINHLRDLSPMQRFGTPEDIAGLVSYLVSDEADFITGQSVSINGGMFYD